MEREKFIKKMQFWGYKDNNVNDFYVYLPPYDNYFVPKVTSSKEVNIDGLTLIVDYSGDKIVGIEFLGH
jgi:hypothetical protein